MKNISIITYLTLAALITGIIMLVYATVQQNFRSSANDPQLQIARDMSESLKDNKTSAALMSGDTVDLTKSLAVFKAIFDEKGKALQCTGVLNGGIPSFPQGVFDFTRQHGEDVVTWQPQKGVRIALVVESVHANGIGFVAAGRSLLEVEKREKRHFNMCAIALVICLTILAGHYVLSRKIIQ